MSKKFAGTFSALAFAFCLVFSGTVQAEDHQAWQDRPIELGTSGGNIYDRSKLYCCGGTLGSLLDIDGTSYVLSNNHVLARTNQANIGDPIIQPGLIDQQPVCYQDENDVIAVLADYIPISFSKGTTNRVDAALALPLGKTVNQRGSILGIGVPSSEIVEPSLGLAVKKSGRTTGVTLGKIFAVGVTIDVQYQPNCGIGKKAVARFVDQFAVSPSGFSAGGDSGSLIVEDVDRRPGRIGLLFAGSSSLTFANKMSDVVAAFTARLGSSGAGQEAQGRGRPDFADQRVERARQIKERYDEFLFGLPEVVGHGVGLSRTSAGGPVIQLYVRRASERARRAAPPAIEGIPVEVVETGDIHAFATSCKPDCPSRTRKLCK